MPISFGSNESENNGVFLRANLPQNRWWLKTDAGDQPVDMGRGVAMDVANMKFGWLHIDIGVRDWQAWPSLTEKTAKPSDAHKQGFEMDCWSSDGMKAQFSGNSYGLGQFVAKLYNEAEKSPEFTQGMVPIVQVTSSTPVVVGKGTSYDVGFAIAKWIKRPADDMPEQPAPVAAPAPAPTAEASGTDFGF